jgi:hypothetical protein
VHPALLVAPFEQPYMASGQRRTSIDVFDAR